MLAGSVARVSRTMTLSLAVTWLSLCVLVSGASGARILLVHVQTFEDAAQLRQVGVELARRGHEVYAATAANHAHKHRVTFTAVRDL